MSKWLAENVRVSNQPSPCKKHSIYYTQWIEKQWNDTSKCSLFVQPISVSPICIRKPTLRSIALGTKKEKSDLQSCAQSQPVPKKPNQTTILCPNSVTIPPKHKCTECIDDNKLPNNSPLNNTQMGNLLSSKYGDFHCGSQGVATSINLFFNENFNMSKEISFVKTVPILGSQGGWKVEPDTPTNFSVSVSADIFTITKIDAEIERTFFEKIHGNWEIRYGEPKSIIHTINILTKPEPVSTDSCLIYSNSATKLAVAQYSNPDNSWQSASITLRSYDLPDLTKNILKSFTFLLPDGGTNRIKRSLGDIFLTSIDTGFSVDVTFRITGFKTTLENNLSGENGYKVKYSKFGDSITKLQFNDIMS